MNSIMKTASDVVNSDFGYICDRLRGELESLSGTRLLITGGGGFLGYYLVQAVLHWNSTRGKRTPVQVTVYDNFMRGAPAWLTALSGNSHLTVVKHDMARPLPQAIGDYDYIIHAASIASPTYYRKHPIETMDANVNGLRALLDYALDQQRKGRPIRGFLFFSTSEIYGDPTHDNIPTPETYRGNVSCTGPRACYDESKRYGETLCINFAQQFSLPIRTARPFNNYGPGLKITDRRAVPDFARDVLERRDIVLYSDGSPTRTFCYVADAIVGYYKVLTRGRSGEAYNIGVEGPEVSIAEVAKRVARHARDLFGYKGGVCFEASSEKDYLVDNPNRRCPVIVKARTELGYEPAITLDEGLRRSLLWYRDNREGEEA